MQRFWKCLWGMLLICLCIAALPGASARAEEDYNAMQSMLQTALDAEAEDEAKTWFGNIVTYYQRHTDAVKGYKDADHLFCYANGRLLYAEGKYEEAYDFFYALPAGFIEQANVPYYLTFCEACFSLTIAIEFDQADDFQAALEGFQTAKELTDSPAVCDQKIKECETAYFSCLKAQGEAYCSEGKHTEAQKSYDIIISFANKGYSAKGRALKKNCVENHKHPYDEATIAKEKGQYAAAATLFGSCGAYRDSQKQLLFCQGMLSIAKADELEAQGYKAREDILSAKTTFLRLQNDGFEGADKLYQYCTARECEMNGFYQKALDLYAELAGVQDSDARFLALNGGKPKKLAEQPEPLPERWQGIEAYVNRTVEVYAGPDKAYTRENTLKVNAGTAFVVCAMEGDFYLIETETEGGKVRLWTTRNRVFLKEVQPVNECGKNSRQTFLLKDSELRCGPGEDYMARTHPLKKGTKVSAFETEDRYVMIEYEIDKQKYRSWILKENLNLR